MSITVTKTKVLDDISGEQDSTASSSRATASSIKFIRIETSDGPDLVPPISLPGKEPIQCLGPAYSGISLGSSLVLPVGYAHQMVRNRHEFSRGPCFVPMLHQNEHSSTECCSWVKNPGGTQSVPAEIARDISSGLTGASYCVLAMRSTTSVSAVLAR
jgi:hypothetical protein